MKHKYTEEELRNAVVNSLSIAEVCRKLNIRPIGGNYKTLKKLFIEFNIDTSHFTGRGWNVGLKFKPNPPKKIEEILIENSNYQGSKLLKRLIKSGIKEYICEGCGNTEWLGEKIHLELHHINGNNTDNRIENIKILCPNCHSFTDNYRRKNNSKSSKMELKKSRYESFLNGELENVITEEEIKSSTKPKTIRYCEYCGVELINNKSKYCSRECYNNATKGKRPDVFDLLSKFETYKFFTKVGEFYGVTDTAVIKWCKFYGIIDKIKELK